MKLVIPGKTLLDDPEEGLDLFINTVKDIKIHFETYSYQTKTLKMKYIFVQR